MIVGTGVPDGPKRADMESAPTDLMVVLKIVCRGGYYPPAIYKNIILFKKDRRGRRSLQICAVFVVFGGGAIRNVFKENLRLAKQSPADDRWSPLRVFNK